MMDITSLLMSYLIVFIDIYLRISIRCFRERQTFIHYVFGVTFSKC